MLKNFTSYCPDDEQCESIEEFEKDVCGFTGFFKTWLKHVERFHSMYACQSTTTKGK